MFWKSWFKPSSADDSAFLLYRNLVDQARSPQFYLNVGVPDTLDGRFDLIVLHMVVVIERLSAIGAPAKDLSQKLFDVMFDDMDQALREIGVGDLSVGKKVKTMARAFYGRLGAYDAAFQDGANEAVKAALKRNVFREAEIAPERLEALTAYLQNVRAVLSETELEVFASGRVQFPAAPEAILAAEVRP
ncbi:MAG: ubiquinol-cytochrome C chaperone [Rhodobiaceae bacterium]|nr:ubiquinol-cytochrome C chaperone [Rhodobiaceae bacterium]